MTFILALFTALSPARAVPPPVPTELLDAVASWHETFPDLDVRIKVQSCGYDNAWYTFSTRTVTLCAELFDRPALATFIFNHEMGHALNDQYGIPWLAGEDAADEIAMLMSSPEETQATAQWFLASNDPSDGEHSSDLDRAAALLCYLDGIDADPVDRQCVVYARSITMAWTRIILMAQG